MNGIDLSQHNIVTNWSEVAKNVDFVILRAGYGKEFSQIDKKFEEYYTECKKRKISVGCYWYSYAKSKDEAEKEADIFLKTIKGKQFEFPVYYDVEEYHIFKLGKKAVSEIITAFCEKVEKAGYFTGFYSNPNFLHNVINDAAKSKFTLWLAHWDTNAPYCDYGIWQRSAKGKISGIDGYVDIDSCEIDFKSKIMELGLNGFSKTETESEIKITVEINGRTYHGTLKE